MKKKFKLYYNEENDTIVEVIQIDGSILVRDDLEVFPISKDDLKLLTPMGDIYSGDILNLKGRWSLRKVYADGTDIYCETGYLQDSLQEGVACKINSLSSWYRTNIVTGITKNTKNVVEFYTLSGSFYRLTKN